MRFEGEEQLEERKLSKAEKDKLSKLKKDYEGGSMHKAMRDKYGDKGDEVFYGKLTNMAKECATVEEAKTKMDGEDPCWDGYEMVGKKKKDGKEVPNCVPVKEGEELEERDAMSRGSIDRDVDIDDIEAPHGHGMDLQRIRMPSQRSADAVVDMLAKYNIDAEVKYIDGTGSPIRGGTVDAYAVTFYAPDDVAQELQDRITKKVYKLEGSELEEAKQSGKTEHSGAKKGKGAYWGRKKDAKDDSNKARRAADKAAVKMDEAEELEELSKNKLSKYAQAAAGDVLDKHKKGDHKAAIDRTKGINKAVKKLSEEDTSHHFKKGDKVMCKGKECVVDVPDGPTNLVGVKPVGGGDVDMVKATELKKVEKKVDESTDELVKDALERFGEKVQTVSKEPSELAKIMDEAAQDVTVFDQKNFPADAVDDMQQKGERTGQADRTGTPNKVPAEVMSAIDKRIKELKASIERYDHTGYNDKSVKQLSVDALGQIKKNLGRGDYEGFMEAQVFFGTLMSPIWDMLPAQVVNYLAKGSDQE